MVVGCLDGSFRDVLFVVMSLLDLCMYVCMPQSVRCSPTPEKIVYTQNLGQVVIKPPIHNIKPFTINYLLYHEKSSLYIPDHKRQYPSNQSHVQHHLAQVPRPALSSD